MEQNINFLKRVLSVPTKTYKEDLMIQFLTEWLVENNILHLICNYKAGKNSRIYSLNDIIFRQRIKRHKNSDKVLIKKYKKKIFETIDYLISHMFLCY